MGLFDKLFVSNVKTEEKTETIQDKAKWYLSEEAENTYYGLPYPERIKHVNEYLLLLSLIEKYGPNKRFDEFEVLKKSYFDNKTRSICLKASYLLVFFIINSKGQTFSGYKNALSENTNNVINIIKKTGYKNIVKELICCLENRTPNYPENYFDFLTRFEENKELYTIERAVLSIFGDNEIIDHYKVNEDGHRANALSYGINYDSSDSLYDDVVEFVRSLQMASTSLLQQRFGIGYNRAARLIDTLEDRGIIGPANGSKTREVYI